MRRYISGVILVTLLSSCQFRLEPSKVLSSGTGGARVHIAFPPEKGHFGIQSLDTGSISQVIVTLYGVPLSSPETQTVSGSNPSVEFGQLPSGTYVVKAQGQTGGPNWANVPGAQVSATFEVANGVMTDVDVNWAESGAGRVLLDLLTESPIRTDLASALDLNALKSEIAGLSVHGSLVNSDTVADEIRDNGVEAFPPANEAKGEADLSVEFRGLLLGDTVAWTTADPASPVQNFSAVGGNETKTLDISPSDELNDAVWAVRATRTRSGNDVSRQRAILVDRGDTGNLVIDFDSSGFANDGGTTALWRMDETTGSTVSDELGVSPGTATGSTIDTGFFGNARLYGGTSSHYTLVPTNMTDAGTIAAINPTGTAFSVEAICKSVPGSLDVYPNIISKPTDNGGGPETYAFIVIPGSNSIIFRLRTTVGTSSVVLTNNYSGLVNKWTYLAGTYDGTTMRAYLNGVPTGFAAKTGNLVSVPSYPLGIGRFPPANINWFRGYIDDVRLSNITRTPTEIANFASDNGF